MNQYSVERFGTSTELAILGWDNLLGTGDFHLSSAWLGVLEEMLSVKPIYLAVRDGKGIASGLVVYSLDDTAPPWDFYRLDRVLDRLGRIAGHDGTAWSDQASAAGEVLPSLLCGGRHTSYSRLLVRPDLDPREANAVTMALLREVDDLAAELGARSAGFMFVDDGDDRLAACLASNGYERFPHGRASSLEVTFADLDDYIAHFSKKRRWSVRKEIRQLAEAGVTFRVRPLDEDTIQQIVPLEIQLEARYGVDDDFESAARNHRIVSRHLGEGIRTVAAEADGRIRGFINVAPWRDDLIVRQAGFDYPFQGRLPLYFGVLFYALVPYAIETGIRRIHYSVESEAAKRSRGCRATSQYGFAKAFDEPWANDLSKAVAMLNNHETDILSAR